MSILNPDLLYPIFDNNRDEILLVEYEGFIKSITEGIVIAMILSKQKWENKYPKIKEFISVVNGEIFDMSSLYSPIEYLKILSGDELAIDEIEKDLEILSPINIIRFQQSTLFDFALRNLIQEKFIKRCHIVKSTPFYNHEIKYLEKAFAHQIDKIDIVSGTTLEAFEEYSPTTCFTNSLDSITRVIEYASNLSLKNIFFVLRNTSETVYYSQEDRLFKYHTGVINKIEIWNKSKQFYVAPMYSFRHENQNNQKADG